MKWFNVRHWVRYHLTRQFTVRYDPFTQSVQVVDDYGDTSCMIEVQTTTFNNVVIFSFQELKLKVTQLSAAFDQIAAK